MHEVSDLCVVYICQALAECIAKKLQDGSLREMYGGVSVPVFVFFVHMCHN